MKLSLTTLLLGIIPVLITSCGYLNKVAYMELEIAPGKRAYVKFVKNGDISLKFNGKVINLMRMEENFAPVSIMESNGLIYMVVFDHRWRKGKTGEDHGFVFFKQSGDKMAEIPAAEFPRSIAIENVWLPGQSKTIRDDGSVVTHDYPGIQRRRNPEDSDFLRSYTALIWHYLERGTPYWKMGGIVEDVPFINDYIAKYNPVMLDFAEMKRVTAKEAGF